MQETTKPIQSFQIPVKDHETEEVIFTFKADLVNVTNEGGSTVEVWKWQTAPVPEEIFEAETQIENMLNPSGGKSAAMSEAYKKSLLATMQFQAVGSGKFHFISGSDFLES